MWRRVGTRLWIACGAVSAWLFLSLIGWLGGGATHLLLLFAALIWPWRSSKRTGVASGVQEADGASGGSSVSTDHRSGLP